jgi:hypothetical protein
LQGFDDEEFNAVGWINPLPPQSDIPGFARVTMMKYFVEESGAVDYGALWVCGFDF